MIRSAATIQAILFLFAALIFLVVPVQSQTAWEFSGYATDLPTYQQQNPTFARLLSADDSQFLNLSRLRLRPTLLLWDDARLALEYEITTLFQSSSSTFLETPETSRRQITSLRWTPVHEPHFDISHFVDRLYFRKNFQSASIVVGRQRIAWGTGRIWNPTDLFSPINPASFDKIEKDGADAISLKCYFGSFTDLEMVYNPEDEFRQSNGAARFHTNFAEYDMSVLGGIFDRDLVLGGDFAGNLFTAGLRGEGIVRFEKHSTVEKYILDLDYQFTSKLYALIEYQFNGEGSGERTSYELQRLLTAEILNLARNYIAVSTTYQLHPLVTAGVTWNANLDDGSGFFSPSVMYSAAANADLGAGGLLTYGGDLSEYWYYPTSIYVKGTFYF